MSPALGRAHFQFRKDSFVVAAINVFLETADERIHCLKIFAAEHFNFKPAEV